MGSAFSHSREVISHPRVLSSAFSAGSERDSTSRSTGAEKTVITTSVPHPGLAARPCMAVDRRESRIAHGPGVFARLWSRAVSESVRAVHVIELRSHGRTAQLTAWSFAADYPIGLEPKVLNRSVLLTTGHPRSTLGRGSPRSETSAPP